MKILIPLEEREKATQASEKLTSLLREFSDMKLDPDFASYILVSAGLGLAIENNESSPMVVTELLSISLKTANETIMHGYEEDEEETKH